MLSVMQRPLKSMIQRCSREQLCDFDLLPDQLSITESLKNVLLQHYNHYLHNIYREFSDAADYY